MVRGSHISLFAGVGMLDIAAEAFGFDTIATAEIDPFCRKVLEARFPAAMHFANVENVRYGDGPWEDHITRPLLISGGFPCQDVSASGTGTGITGARSGLWSEFARVIREFQPDLVLIENSPLLRQRGLHVILMDLDSMGYAAQWDCIPAAHVGAPHRRDRIFIVAWKTTSTDQAGEDLYNLDTLLTRSGGMDLGLVWETPALAPVKGRSQYPTPTRSDGAGGPGTSPRRTGGKNLRTVAFEHEGSGRLHPAWVEWLMGVPEGWTDPTVPSMAFRQHSGWRVDDQPKTANKWSNVSPFDRAKRIRALGNGAVPQAALFALQHLTPYGASTPWGIR
jgi:DNA (cytosine-5)-methyltransferase 1